ncbi:hypothetical protein H6F98_05365 [Microcoleus sp. FACHB-SPT15]|jgi:hypothetical protein|uniref:hypothetical protein n=1 Tax=Microcoleus sp. FACHB-SPT15 TaxID=2692830 RepID=UPI00178066E0|nr:hypothetical protein [Microcoleus sp. FACHB-SPT15]MBD1804884.1 hypothetical protein [Microcoleus sp. FACHB-SPT15]
MCLLNPISQQELVLFVTGLYVSTAFYCFATCLKVFKRENDLSVAERWLSWGVLALATILWPIVVPLSYLERRSFGSEHF